MSETDTAAATKDAPRLPPCYKSLTPLIADRHKDVTYRRNLDYSFAREVNAVPLMAEEFPRAQVHFPIVFTRAEPHLPVALLGPEPGKNDFVAEDGSWRPGAYVPAYLRRYPFALVGDGTEGGRLLLCADLEADFFKADEGGALFEGDEGTDLAKSIMDFCTRYEQSLNRTRAMTKELAELDLLEDSVVNVQRGEKQTRVEGFRLISDKKMRDLDDAKLADLTRRGVASIISAHQFSINQFSGMFETAL